MSKCSHYGCRAATSPGLPVCKAHLVKELRLEGYKLSDEQVKTMTVEEILNFVEHFETEASA